MLKKRSYIKTGKLGNGYLEDLAGVQVVSLDLWASVSGHCDSVSHGALCKSEGAWSGQGWRSASPAASQESLTSPCHTGSRLALAAGLPHILLLRLPFRSAGLQGSAAPCSLTWAAAWLGGAKPLGQEVTWTLRYRAGLILCGWQK